MLCNKKLIAAALAAAALSAGAEPRDGLEAAVSRLGELNGVALACKQGALAARVREIVIANAPKERGVGEFFEQATSSTFLAFGSSGSECPDGRSLAGQIDAAQQQLLLARGEKP